MTNNSSTGGYLVPNPLPAPTPLEGLELQDFLQEVLVGVTGLDGKLVRPRWLSEPSNIPVAGVCWCAFGIMNRPSDTFPQVIHVTDADNVKGVDQMQRHETLNLVASFYDLGSSGLADYYAAILRDGLIIAQNREVLQANGFDFAYSGEPTPVPLLMKERWQYRVDLDLAFRRQIDRNYPVWNLRKMRGNLIEDGIPINISLAVDPSSSGIGEFIIGESPIEELP